VSYYRDRVRRQKRRRTAAALALLLPVLVLALLSIWTAGTDLDRHEQYGATAALWFMWLCVASWTVGMARDSASGGTS
jgi:hypothetical protein